MPPSRLSQTGGLRLMDDPQMRANRLEVPVWILAVIGGTLFGASMGFFARRGGADWVSVGVAVLVPGVIFGGGMWSWASTWLTRMKEAVGDLPADKAKSVRQAAARGPVPSDPEVRAAALRLARAQLAEYAGMYRWGSVAVLTLLTFGFIVRAVTDSLLALAPALLFGALLFGQWYMPRRLRRRISLLSEA